MGKINIHCRLLTTIPPCFKRKLLPLELRRPFFRFLSARQFLRRRRVLRHHLFHVDVVPVFLRLYPDYYRRINKMKRRILRGKNEEEEFKKSKDTDHLTPDRHAFSCCCCFMPALCRFNRVLSDSLSL